MRVTTVFTKGKYEIRLFEFISPAGRIITYFFQLHRAPGVSLGSFNTIEEPMLLLQNTDLVERSFIEKSAEYFLGDRVLIGKDELISGVLVKGAKKY
ncbi:MAG: hypothetical protein AAGC78_06865 [Cellvibrio sp.]|uniref:hypothetical protein n=1 Tax=Cellvibrio sp. TaxID=1965322 RepID=UPI0031AB6564